MGLFSRSKPKIQIRTTAHDGFSGWIKCSDCSELVHANELESHLNCCPKCGHHYRLSLRERIDLLSDSETYQEMFQEIKPFDSLNFEDTEKYKDRLEKAQKKTGRDEAISVGICQIDTQPVALAVMDFNFMGGSMGSALGERLTLLIEYATVNRLPLVIVSASGGARMQESILSLMQMAKTASALQRFSEKGLLYVSVLTNPTSGGVTASFATLGDVILAEPDALIAFAGPRVVEQTIGQTLPKGAQKSKFLLDRGMIDRVVPRKELKKQLSLLLKLLTRGKRERASTALKKLIDKSSLKTLPSE